jgi:N4-gp56 family major capsid protein
MATTTVNLNNPLDDGSKNLFNEIIIEAQYTAQENSIMRPLVNMVPVANAVGNVVQIPKFGLLTVEDGLTEGADLTGSDLTTSVHATITMAERAAMTLLTDDAIETMPNYNLAGEIGRILGQQMAVRFDTDAMGKFADFSGSSNAAFGATGAGNDVELTADLLFKASAELRSNLAGGNMVAVFHPRAVYNLKKQLANAGATELGALSNVGNSALSTGLVGSVAGITIFESTLATVGGVFALDAMGGAMKRDVRLETERDASKRATEIVGSAVWGFSAVKPENGVKIYTNNAI